jgi:hypothetical protein
MTRRRQLLLTAAALAAWCGPLSAQQPRPGGTELPVTRVVLFTSGVGYFQRGGTLDGNARVELQFPAAGINDLLKSLVLQDLGGGQVSAVTYDNRDPVEKTLRSFAIDLTNNPSLGQLLQQVRGERVEVELSPEKGLTDKVTGTIVGVEKQKRPVGKDQVVEAEQLNLLTEDGLRGVQMEQVRRVRFLKPELEQEFRKALAVLATAHDKLKKAVTLGFVGNGKRDVQVGYVAEAPMWKTSYRLRLDKDKAFLQGWAIVENTSDEDWKDVSLALISGRPLSFKMDLYDPLYVPRPTVEPELFASLRPPTYGGAMDSAQPRRRAAAPMPKNGGPAARGRLGGGYPGAPAPAQQPDDSEPVDRVVEQFDKKKAELDFRQGVASAAVATELGEYFQYQIEQPVSLPRQKSALLPIVNSPVEGTRVSIYNEAVHPKYALLGLRFKNTSGLQLMQGPLTVYEGSSYAGDARISDLQKDEARLLSYAVDLGTEVVPESKGSIDTLVAVKIIKGILEATTRLRQEKTYRVKNRGGEAKTVVVEHPVHPGWELKEPAKPAERSRDFYRFEIKAEPNKTIVQEVVEETPQTTRHAITNLDDDTVLFYVRSAAVGEKVKEALRKALELRGKMTRTQQLIAREEQAVKAIESDQERMRGNMQRLPQASEVYKRYLRKFEEQENDIEKRRAEVVRLQEQQAQEAKAYQDFVAGLTVE